MINYRVDIAVDRPAADVFPYLADINVFPKWMGGTSTQPISGGAMQVGYRYTYLTDEGKFEMEVTELEPGRSVSTRTLAGPFDWEGTFRVTDDGDAASHVVSSGRIRLSGIKRLAEPFMGGEVRRRERAELTRLKALVEGSAG
jgi:uncharacterized membrane protein